MKTRIERVRLHGLKGQERNARFFRHEQFQALVTNIRRDGVLTSTPLVHEEQGGQFRILSGHHRVAAAIEAGVEYADCIVVEDSLTRQQEIAIVLSHNAIVGEDDPATLKALYEELDDVEWREYSGLDDKTLGLLDDVSIDSLSEAQLDFTSVQITFLPEEKEAAERAFEEARKMSSADEHWLAALGQHSETLDALSTARFAATVGNVATALGVILAVFERHIGDTREWWLDDDGAPTTKGRVPIESILGTRTIPADAGAVVNQAVQRIAGREELAPHELWRALEFMAASYLAEG